MGMVQKESYILPILEISHSLSALLILKLNPLDLLVMSCKVFQMMLHDNEQQT
jgi:hypothetical protein